jgi:outer membrane biosynthesis protein TonB
MDPIKINVNVEVGLKQTTLEALAALFGRPSAPGFDPLPAPATEEKPQPQPEPKRKAKKAEPVPEPEAPAPAPDPEPAPADDDNLPPDDAPAPKKATPTEDDARQAVKAARGRGVPAKAIKDYMQETFNIASSVECPAERRQELIDGLSKLAA